MAITSCGSGTIITGERDIALYRLMTLHSALGLEIKGIKVKRWSIYAQAKRELGLRGNRTSVHAQLGMIIERLKVQRLQQDGVVHG